MRLSQSPKAMLLLAMLCASVVGLAVLIPVLIVAGTDAKPTQTLAPKRNPSVIHRRHEVEEVEEKSARDKKVPLPPGFSNSDFIEIARWLSSQEKKTALTLRVQGMHVDWVVEVDSVSSYGVTFRVKEGVGVGTTNGGFYKKIQPYTTTFRQGNDWIKRLQSGDRVKLSGTVSAIVDTISIHQGYFFIIEDFTLSQI